MQRSTRFNRPGLKGSSKDALLFSSGEQFILKVAPDTTTSIALAWTESFPKPDDYRVERSLDGSSFTTVTTVGNTVFDYTDTGRTESTQYWYRIVPILSGVDQPPSNIADTWTVPSTPTGLTATAISSTQINLAWSDVSTGNTAQSIQRRSPAGSGSYSFIASVGATATAYSDTGLTASTQYEYQVAATNPATQSAWSTAANATTTGGGPPASSWTLDFSSGEPWANGTNYVFSSTASTSRTFVNSSGYVAPCVANLVLRSQEFNTFWAQARMTVTANSVASPDNTTTAETITEDTTIQTRGLWQAVSATSGASYTLSCYIKKGTQRYVCVGFWDSTSSNSGAQFDLDNITATAVWCGAYGASSNATITDVGNGWYRCSVTCVAALSVDYPAVTHRSTASTAGSGGSIVNGYAGSTSNYTYVWGFQMTAGTAALPYSATTTSSNGIPRLTHNSSGSRLGLLVEGQRTNLALRSEEFNNATWLQYQASVTANSIAAPDNTTTADSHVETSANESHIVYQEFLSQTKDAEYTFSVFVKKGGRDYVALYWNFDALAVRRVMVNLTNGTISDAGSPSGLVPVSASETVTDFGNGWYRVAITAKASNASGTNSASILIAASDRSTFTGALQFGAGFPQYSGNTGIVAVYMWGAQWEKAGTASSYIPTTTASVTRSADLAYVETADVTNWGRPGSFVVEYYRPLEQSGGVVVADDDGAGNAGRLGVEYSSGGPRIVYGTSGSGSGGTDSAGLNKIGWAWNGSGAATRSALNGSALDTSLATSFDPTLTDGINLGGNIDWSTLPLTVSGQPNVVIRKVQFWNSQLSAADLNTLTGPTAFDVQYLVVAGGGGGGGSASGNGAASGGGAGGFRTASGFTLTPGTSYTITVGAGGAGGAAGANSGSVGNNSVFSTITSDGGGNGRNGRGGGQSGLAGGNGGSGGGGGYGDSAGGAAGLGTSGQGNNGAAGWSGAPYHAGGGGGAGGAAVTLTNTQPGNGGAASASSISGSSLNYAGGGGGGGSGTIAAGTAGSQGGNGGGFNTAGSNATANRGGGGGGAGDCGSGNTRAGGNGGSGVVIIRMATANYSGVHTPATVTTSGSDTILTFTSSGFLVA